MPARERVIFLVSATILGVALWGCTSTPPGGGGSCATSAECINDGQLCKGGTCASCGSDSECRADPNYWLGASCRSGACIPCTQGEAGCACIGGTTCNPNLVCDATLGSCRTPFACAALSCVPNQRCQPAGTDTDAACLDGCVPGYTWDPISKTCSQVASNCFQSDPQSILAQCDGENRVCIESGGSAACGDCKQDYIDTGGACVAITSCTQLDCAVNNRDCEPNPTPVCTGCLPFFIEEAGVCRPVATCVDLTCGGNQTCEEGDATTDAACVVACSASEVPVANPQPGGKTCAPCFCDGPGESNTWEPVASGAEDCVCITDEGWYFDEGDLRAQPCDEDGDGWIRQSATSAMSTGADPLIRKNARCTVRRVETITLESDPGMHDTPRQYVIDLTSTAEVFDLVESDTIDDPETLELKSSTVNVNELPVYSDDIHLKAEHLNGFTKACVSAQADFNLDGLSDLEHTQGTATSIFAKYAYFVELHRGWFTTESQMDPTAAEGRTIQIGSYHIREKRRPEAPYAADTAANLDVNRVSFQYAEAEAIDPDPVDHWKTCIRRGMLALPPPTEPGYDFARFDEDSATGFPGMTHYSQFRCAKLTQVPGLGTVGRADLWDGSPGDPKVTGIQQWNTCTAVPDPMPDPPPGATYGNLTNSVDPVTIGIPNPLDPEIQCTPMTTDVVDNTVLPDNTVGWVLRRYTNDAGAHVAGVWTGVDVEPGPYQGGCINECAEQNTLPTKCRGYGTPGQACEDASDNFGRLICGCALNYGGLNCDVPCPQPNLHTQYNAEDTMRAGRARMGYWVCGEFTGTEGEILFGRDDKEPGDGTVFAENPQDPSVGYTLSDARVPATPAGGLATNEVTVEVGFDACGDTDATSLCVCDPANLVPPCFDSSGLTLGCNADDANPCEVMGMASAGCFDNDDTTACYTVR